MSRKTIKDLQAEVEILEGTMEGTIKNFNTLVLLITTMQQQIATLKETDSTITQSMNTLMVALKIDSVGGDIAAGDILRSYG